MTDERDPKVSRRYRELGAEEPSRETDQAILAAAHRAADRPHAPLVTPAGRHRWYFAFGAAAILVLAVAVTVQMERQQPDPEALSESPDSVRADRAERFSYQQEQEKDGRRGELQRQAEGQKPLADSDRARAPAAEPRRKFAQEAAPPASAPAQPSAEAPSPPADAAAEADRRARATIQPREVQRAPAAQSTVSPGVMARVQVSPEELLQRIAELRKDARHDEADKLLAEFRQRYPDYRISDEMLQKVERRK
jgi:hypothetical protein